MADVTFDAAVFALRGLVARQRATAENVANAETPGYRAREVDFEDSLRAALASGDLQGAEISERTTLDPAQPNGNNVQLDEELVGTTGLQYQLMTEVLNFKFRLLGTSIGTNR